MTEEAIRSAALAWLFALTHDGQLPATRDQLANDFVVDGVRFPLLDRGRGIRKPAGWTSALSITTTAPTVGRPRPFQIHRRLLADIDGPMLRHGLQHHHGRPLMRLPQRHIDRPDPDRLMERFAEFEAA